MSYAVNMTDFVCSEQGIGSCENKSFKVLLWVRRKHLSVQGAIDRCSGLITRNQNPLAPSGTWLCPLVGLRWDCKDDTDCSGYKQDQLEVLHVRFVWMNKILPSK